MKITEQELEIFSRQLILKEFDLPIFNNLQKKPLTHTKISMWVKEIIILIFN